MTTSVIIKLQKAADAVPAVQALSRGGMNAAEITFRTDAAMESTPPSSKGTGIGSVPIILKPAPIRDPPWSSMTEVLQRSARLMPPHSIFLICVKMQTGSTSRALPLLRVNEVENLLKSGGSGRVSR
ncbi:MAG: hypothetical protein K9K78_07575 [Spirochaetales bacterium]|nr:hypothetical protein [Spirochaetales bacterium]